MSALRRETAASRTRKEKEMRDEYDCSSVEPFSWSTQVLIQLGAATVLWFIIAAILFHFGILTW